MNKNKYKKKAFCGGTLCRKSDRKYKCFDCNVYMCSVCKVEYNKKQYCVNCYVKKYLIKDIENDIDKFNDELNKWIKN